MLAPEVARMNQTYDSSQETSSMGQGKAVDVWSLGTLAYELANGSAAYTDSTHVSSELRRNSYDSLSVYELKNDKKRSDEY